MKRRYRPVILIIIDILLIYLSYIFAFLIRFEWRLNVSNFDTFVEVAFILVAIKIVTFYYFKLYENLWRYAGVLDVLQIVIAVGTANAVAISYLFLMQANLPRSIYVLSFILDVFFIGGSRFGYRVIRELTSGRLYAINKNSRNRHSVKVLIIGAGKAGAMVIKELRSHPELNTKPVAILDDDREKLFEELFLEEEKLDSTGHDKIFVGQPIDNDLDGFSQELGNLKEILANGDDHQILDSISRLANNHESHG